MEIGWFFQYTVKIINAGDTMNKELCTDSLKFHNKGISWNLSEFRTNVKKKKKKVLPSTEWSLSSLRDSASLEV